MSEARFEIRPVWLRAAGEGFERGEGYFEVHAKKEDGTWEMVADFDTRTKAQEFIEVMAEGSIFYDRHGQAL